MKVATGSQKRTGKKLRTACPACRGAYMQNASVLIHDEKKRSWKTVGKYCSACKNFIQNKEDSLSDDNDKYI